MIASHKVFIFIRRILLFFLGMGVLLSAEAAKHKSAGIGQVAENMMAPVDLFESFVRTGCFVIGGSFIFASIIKYIEHKRSPLMVPLSTVIFLFLAGLFLLFLPFVYMLAG